ncbi:hypothetical protein Q574_02366 [Staphylococcus aureus M1523]|nr:hypothetical protein Q574_02366 [Staphylococcus aureus M1523]
MRYCSSRSKSTVENVKDELYLSSKISNDLIVDSISTMANIKALDQHISDLNQQRQQYTDVSLLKYLYFSKLVASDHECDIAHQDQNLSHNELQSTVENVKDELYLSSKISNDLIVDSISTMANIKALIRHFSFVSSADFNHCCTSWNKDNLLK